MIRPLMEKVQKKSYDAVLRKFTFPHVSGAATGVLELVGLAGLHQGRISLPFQVLSLPRQGFFPVPGSLLCPVVSPFLVHLEALPRSSASCQAGLAGPAGSPSPGSHPTGPDFPALPCSESPAPQGIPAVPQPVVPGCASLTSCLFFHAATPRLLRQESSAAPLPVLPVPGALETWLH